MADINPADDSTANLGLKERAEYTNLSQPLVMRLSCILKSLGFCVNLLFKNRENREKRGKITLKLYLYLTAIKQIVIVLIKTSMFV